MSTTSATWSTNSGVSARAGVASDGAAPSPAAVPATVIEPQAGGWSLDVGEIRRYHELLYFLVWRDLKVQYKQTVLGPAWAVLRPVVSLVIFSVIFGKLAGIPSGDVPYPIFVYAGLLPWTFFSNALVSASGSLVNHAYLLTKVYFPRILLPAASITANLVTLAINFAIYAALMIGYGHFPGTSVLLLPVLIVLNALIAFGLGLFLCGLAIIYRDVRFVLGSVVGAWMYLTPVIYPVTLVPESWRWLLWLNPMTGVIGGFRSVLLNEPLDLPALGSSVLFAVIILAAGLRFFHLTQRRVADVA